MILDFKDLSSFATGETYMSEKDSIVDRADEALKEFWNPDNKGPYFSARTKVIALAQQELDRQASDAVEKERAKIADELAKFCSHSMAGVYSDGHGLSSDIQTYIDQLRGQSK